MATLALVAAMVILAWPVNYYVRAPLVLLPTDAARVYATVDGTLRSALPAGKQVAANEPIAELENAEVEIELARLTGEHELARLRLENLEKLRGVDSEAGPKIPAARATLADLTDTTRRPPPRRRPAHARRPRRRHRHPRTGDRHAEHADDGRLPTWSGQFARTSTITAHSSNPARSSASSAIRSISPPCCWSTTPTFRASSAGQTVRLVLEQTPGDRFSPAKSSTSPATTPNRQRLRR